MIWKLPHEADTTFMAHWTITDNCEFFWYKLLFILIKFELKLAEETQTAIWIWPCARFRSLGFINWQHSQLVGSLERSQGFCSSPWGVGGCVSLSRYEEHFEAFSYNSTREKQKQRATDIFKWRTTLKSMWITRIGGFDCLVKSFSLHNMQGMYVTSSAQKS